VAENPVTSPDDVMCSTCHAAKATTAHRDRALCRQCYESNVPPWERAISSAPVSTPPSSVSVQVGIPIDPQPSRWRRLWPRIDGLATAEAATQYGFFAALLCAGATAVLILIGELGIRPFGPDRLTTAAFVDAAVFLAIAWGIRRAYRVAALAGLALYLVELWYAWSTTGQTVQVIAVFLILYFIHGIRGAFAVHQYSAAQR
jgi:hypothetical protein